MQTDDHSTVPDVICPACGAHDGFVLEPRDKTIDYRRKRTVITALQLRYCCACGEGFDADNGEMQRMADTLRAFTHDVDAAQGVRFKVMWSNTKTKSPLTPLFQRGDKYSALPK